MANNDAGDLEDGDDEFITLRLYPETTAIFCKALQLYAKHCKKSQKIATREQGKIALTWMKRLQTVVEEDK